MEGSRAEREKVQRCIDYSTGVIPEDSRVESSNYYPLSMSFLFGKWKQQNEWIYSASSFSDLCFDLLWNHGVAWEVYQWLSHFTHLTLCWRSVSVSGSMTDKRSVTSNEDVLQSWLLSKRLWFTFSCSTIRSWLWLQSGSKRIKCFLTWTVICGVLLCCFKFVTYSLLWVKVI